METLVKTPAQESLMQQFRQMLEQLGMVMLQGMHYGEKINIEQQAVFSKCRDMVVANWGMEALKAANFCRLALNEAVRSITGKDHYTPEELAIIINKAF